MTITNDDNATGGHGEDLRASRERAGLTRARLAGLAGCSISTLAAIEQGAVPKRSGVLDRVAEVLAAREADGSADGARDERNPGAHRGSATMAGHGHHDPE